MLKGVGNNQPYILTKNVHSTTMYGCAGSRRRRLQAGGSGIPGSGVGRSRATEITISYIVAGRYVLRYRFVLQGSCWRNWSHMAVHGDTHCIHGRVRRCGDAEFSCWLARSRSTRRTYPIAVPVSAAWAACFLGVCALVVRSVFPGLRCARLVARWHPIMPLVTIQTASPDSY